VIVIVVILALGSSFGFVQSAERWPKEPTEEKT